MRNIAEPFTQTELKNLIVTYWDATIADKPNIYLGDYPGVAGDGTDMGKPAVNNCLYITVG